MRKLSKHLTGWCKRGGYVNKEHVPFKELRPLKLNNELSGSNSQAGGATCIHEMSILFACLKKNEFKEAKCSTEIATFQKCYNSSVAERRRLSEQGKMGILVPGEKKLTPKQATQLLRKYPLL